MYHLFFLYRLVNRPACLIVDHEPTPLHINVLLTLFSGTLQHLPKRIDHESYDCSHGKSGRLVLPFSCIDVGCLL